MSQADGMSVREASARLGLPPATLRTWERRYGLGPSTRSAGGHRRYSEGDVARLAVVGRLVADGMTPAQAVGAVIADPDVTPTGVGRSGDEISRDLVSVLLALAARGDTDAMRRHVNRAVQRRGVARAWEEVIVPLLQTIGEKWRDPDFGIHGEHLTSEVVATALRAATNRAAQRASDSDARDVLLATVDEEQHGMPVMALEAALAEVGLSSRSLGSRVPTSSLIQEFKRTRPRAVFVWATMRHRGSTLVADLAEAADSPTLLLIGGPGWEPGVADDVDTLLLEVRTVSSLVEARDAVAELTGGLSRSFTFDNGRQRDDRTDASSTDDVSAGV